jgi:tubulin polyglutamylase TTLL6/13
MITNDMKPYLIEINHTPSFETSTPLDYRIKKNLIKDTLKLMRINIKNKKILFDKAKIMLK